MGIRIKGPHVRFPMHFDCPGDTENGHAAGPAPLAKIQSGLGLTDSHPKKEDGE